MKIDFSNPFLGRKYLKLFNANSSFGLIFKKNLKKRKSYLGFSFKTNELGLRGQTNITSSNIVAGTSFAMGLGVDEGKNWYDLIGEFPNLNIALPTGINELRALMHEFSRSTNRRVFFIYHPNIWVLSRNNFRAKLNNVSIFNLMGWKKNFLSAVRIYLKRLFINKDNIIEVNGYKINTSYSYYDAGIFHDDICFGISEFSKLCDELILIRIPVKEELIERNFLDDKSYKRVKKLQESYDTYFEEFVKSANGNNLRVLDARTAFDMSDYLQFDTHWNEAGNRKFARYFENNFTW